MGSHRGKFNPQSRVARIVARHDQQDAVSQRQMQAGRDGGRGQAVAESAFDGSDHIDRLKKAPHFDFAEARGGWRVFHGVGGVIWIL
jgi:hypothetical protein